MKPLSRRTFSKQIGAATLLSLGQISTWGRGAQPIVRRNPMASFDRVLEEFMELRRVPGASLAVVKRDRLVYARGYGWADDQAKVKATPKTLFRIASVSKPITGTAVLLLVQQGKLKLEDRLLDHLNIQGLSGGGPTDARWEKITLRHLLHHAGGWDRDASFDPMFRSRQIAQACGGEAPATAAMIIRYMASQPLDFDPGAKYAYSNFGYCLLGRVIEKVTGLSYGEHIRKALLEPFQMVGMRLGKSLWQDRQPGEARYVASGTAQSVFGQDSQKVEWPYGGFCLEAMDAHGGWLASAVDLARLAARLSPEAPNPLLRPETLERLYERPDGSPGSSTPQSPSPTWYGCGWSVRKVADNRGFNYWHNGSLPGTFTLLVRRNDGLSWVALLNKRSETKEHPDTTLDGELHKAANAVKQWPTHDLFSKFRPAHSHA